jgi:hypothetical protein
MKTKEMDEIAENTPEITMLRMDGYDDCCIGVVERFGEQPIFCYSIRKVIRKLVGQGMTEEEAVEFFEFNQAGAWMGEGTPCFLSQ